MGNCPQTAVIINWFGPGRLQELRVQAGPQQQQYPNHGVGTTCIRVRAISLWLG